MSEMAKFTSVLKLQTFLHFCTVLQRSNTHPVIGIVEFHPNEDGGEEFVIMTLAI